MFNFDDARNFPHSTFKKSEGTFTEQTFSEDEDPVKHFFKEIL